MDKLYSLGFLLNRASVSLAKALNARLNRENIDLPHSQFVVLRSLYYRDGLSQLDIAKLLSKDAAAIKRTIDNLEEKGFVERRQVRPLKNHIHITGKGKELMPEALCIADEVLAEAKKGIDTVLYKQLEEMLETIFLNTDKQ